LPPVIKSFVANLAAIFNERLLGVYLGGSYAMGDFVDGTSDYDLLVVVEGDLSAGDLDALAALHDRLARDDPDARRLEVDYAPRHLLVPRGTTAPVPGVYDGRFQRDITEIMLSADNLANMRWHGIVVYGAPASEVLPDVTPDDVRAAARHMALDGAGPCAGEREAASELLNLARSLASMESGQPTTKSQGAAWALADLDDRWRPVVERALAVRRGAPVEDSDRTLRDALPELSALARTMANS
jgi:streptomycin 3"-adenylyltransferase